MESLNWDGLPVEFKVEVASLLDVKDRLSLQLTSKSTSSIVSYCPIHLEQLTIKPEYSQLENKTKITYKACSPEKNTLRVAFGVEDGVIKFLKNFENRKSLVENLKFENSAEFGDFLIELLKQINKEKAANDKNIKIRVKKLEWLGCYRTEYKRFTKLLTYFDTNVLESITIDCFQMTKDAVDRLMATEQLKMVKMAQLSLFITVPVEMVFHIPTIVLRMNIVTADSAVKLIENFQTEPRLDNNYFALTARDNIDRTLKNEIFDLLGLSMDRRKSLSSDRHNHVLSFPCHNPDSSFLLKIDNHSVFGVIVSKEFISSLKMDISVFMNLREYGFDWSKC